jgi:hypothetical protein
MIYWMENDCVAFSIGSIWNHSSLHKTKNTKSIQPNPNNNNNNNKIIFIYEF